MSEPEAMKVCKGCEQSLPANDEHFFKRPETRDGLFSKCKRCEQERRAAYRLKYPEKTREQATRGHRKWRQSNPDKAREVRRRFYRKLRNQVLAAYGGDTPSCACCGEATWEFLVIDHVNGGGSQHRRELRNFKIYQWLRDNGYPAGFQILCHNCNMAKSLYGCCPHQTLEPPSILNL